MIRLKTSLTIGENDTRSRSRSDGGASAARFPRSPEGPPMERSIGNGGIGVPEKGGSNPRAGTRGVDDPCGKADLKISYISSDLLCRANSRSQVLHVDVAQGPLQPCGAGGTTSYLRKRRCRPLMSRPVALLCVCARQATPRNCVKTSSNQEDVQHIAHKYAR